MQTAIYQSPYLQINHWLTPTMKGNAYRNLPCHCNRQVKIFIIYSFIFGNWCSNWKFWYVFTKHLAFKKSIFKIFLLNTLLKKKHNSILHFLKSQLFQKPQFQKFNQTHSKSVRENTYIRYLWDNYSLFSLLLWNTLKIKRRYNKNTEQDITN